MLNAIQNTVSLVLKTRHNILNKCVRRMRKKQASHYDDVVFCTLDAQTKYACTGVGYSRALVKEG